MATRTRDDVNKRRYPSANDIQPPLLGRHPTDTPQAQRAQYRNSKGGPTNRSGSLESYNNEPGAEENYRPSNHGNYRSNRQTIDENLDPQHYDQPRNTYPHHFKHRVKDEPQSPPVPMDPHHGGFVRSGSQAAAGLEAPRGHRSSSQSRRRPPNSQAIEPGRTRHNDLVEEDNPQRGNRYYGEPPQPQQQRSRRDSSASAAHRAPSRDGGGGGVEAPPDRKFRHIQALPTRVSDEVPTAITLETLTEYERRVKLLEEKEEKMLSEIKSRTNALRKREAELEGQLEAIQEREAALKRRQLEIEVEIGRKKDELAAHTEAQQALIDTQMNRLGAEKERLQSERAALREEQAELYRQIEKLKEEQADYDRRNGELLAATELLKVKQVKLEERIAHHRAVEKEMKRRIAELRQKEDEVKHLCDKADEVGERKTQADRLRAEAQKELSEALSMKESAGREMEEARRLQAEYHKLLEVQNQLVADLDRERADLQRQLKEVEDTRDVFEQDERDLQVARDNLQREIDEATETIRQRELEHQEEWSKLEATRARVVEITSELHEKMAVTKDEAAAVTREALDQAESIIQKAKEDARKIKAEANELRKEMEDKLAEEIRRTRDSAKAQVEEVRRQVLAEAEEEAQRIRENAGARTSQQEATRLSLTEKERELREKESKLNAKEELLQRQQEEMERELINRRRQQDTELTQQVAELREKEMQLEAAQEELRKANMQLADMEEKLAEDEAFMHQRSLDLDRRNEEVNSLFEKQRREKESLEEVRRALAKIELGLREKEAQYTNIPPPECQKGLAISEHWEQEFVRIQAMLASGNLDELAILATGGQSDKAMGGDRKTGGGGGPNSELNEKSMLSVLGGRTNWRSAVASQDVERMRQRRSASLSRQTSISKPPITVNLPESNKVHLDVMDEAQLDAAASKVSGKHLPSQTKMVMRHNAGGRSGGGGHPPPPAEVWHLDDDEEVPHGGTGGGSRGGKYHGGTGGFSRNDSSRDEAVDAQDGGDAQEEPLDRNNGRPTDANHYPRGHYRHQDDSEQPPIHQSRRQDNFIGRLGQRFVDHRTPAQNDSLADDQPQRHSANSQDYSSAVGASGGGDRPHGPTPQPSGSTGYSGSYGPQTGVSNSGGQAAVETERPSRRHYDDEDHPGPQRTQTDQFVYSGPSHAAQTWTEDSEDERPSQSYHQEPNNEDEANHYNDSGREEGKNRSSYRDASSCNIAAESSQEEGSSGGYHPHAYPSYYDSRGSHRIEREGGDESNGPRTYDDHQDSEAFGAEFEDSRPQSAELDVQVNNKVSQGESGDSTHHDVVAVNHQNRVTPTKQLSSKIPTHCRIDRKVQPRSEDDQEDPDDHHHFPGDDVATYNHSQTTNHHTHDNRQQNRNQNYRSHNDRSGQQAVDRQPPVDQQQNYGSHNDRSGQQPAVDDENFGDIVWFIEHYKLTLPQFVTITECVLGRRNKGSAWNKLFGPKGDLSTEHTSITYDLTKMKLFTLTQAREYSAKLLTDRLVHTATDHSFDGPTKDNNLHHQLLTDEVAPPLLNPMGKCEHHNDKLRRKPTNRFPLEYYQSSNSAHGSLECFRLPPEDQRVCLPDGSLTAPTPNEVNDSWSDPRLKLYEMGPPRPVPEGYVRVSPRPCDPGLRPVRRAPPNGPLQVGEHFVVRKSSRPPPYVFTLYASIGSEILKRATVTGDKNLKYGELDREQRTAVDAYLHMKYLLCIKFADPDHKIELVESLMRQNFEEDVLVSDHAHRQILMEKWLASLEAMYDASELVLPPLPQMLTPLLSIANLDYATEPMVVVTSRTTPIVPKLTLYADLQPPHPLPSEYELTRPNTPITTRLPVRTARVSDYTLVVAGAQGVIESVPPPCRWKDIGPEDQDLIRALIILTNARKVFCKHGEDLDADEIARRTDTQNLPPLQAILAQIPFLASVTEYATNRRIVWPEPEHDLTCLLLDQPLKPKSTERRVRQGLLTQRGEPTQAPYPRVPTAVVVSRQPTRDEDEEAAKSSPPQESNISSPDMDDDSPSHPDAADVPRDLNKQSLGDLQLARNLRHAARDVTDGKLPEVLVRHNADGGQLADTKSTLLKAAAELRKTLSQHNNFDPSDDYIKGLYNVEGKHGGVPLTKDDVTEVDDRSELFCALQQRSLLDDDTDSSPTRRDEQSSKATTPQPEDYFGPHDDLLMAGDVDDGQPSRKPPRLPFATLGSPDVTDIANTFRDDEESIDSGRESRTSTRVLRKQLARSLRRAPAVSPSQQTLADGPLYHSRVHAALKSRKALGITMTLKDLDSLSFCYGDEPKECTHSERMALTAVRAHCVQVWMSSSGPAPPSAAEILLVDSPRRALESIPSVTPVIIMGKDDFVDVMHYKWDQETMDRAPNTAHADALPKIPVPDFIPKSNRKPRWRYDQVPSATDDPSVRESALAELERNWKHRIDVESRKIRVLGETPPHIGPTMIVLADYDPSECKPLPESPDYKCGAYFAGGVAPVRWLAKCLPKPEESKWAVAIMGSIRTRETEWRAYENAREGLDAIAAGRLIPSEIIPRLRAKSKYCPEPVPYDWLMSHCCSYRFLEHLDNPMISRAVLLRIRKIERVLLLSIALMVRTICVRLGSEVTESGDVDDDDSAVAECPPESSVFLASHHLLERMSHHNGWQRDVCRRLVPILSTSTLKNVKVVAGSATSSFGDLQKCVDEVTDELDLKDLELKDEASAFSDLNITKLEIINAWMIMRNSYIESLVPILRVAHLEAALDYEDFCQYYLESQPPQNVYIGVDRAGKRVQKWADDTVPLALRERPQIKFGWLQKRVLTHKALRSATAREESCPRYIYSLQGLLVRSAAIALLQPLSGSDRDTFYIRDTASLLTRASYEFLDKYEALLYGGPAMINRHMAFYHSERMKYLANLSSSNHQQLTEPTQNASPVVKATTSTEMVKRNGPNLASHPSHSVAIQSTHDLSDLSRTHTIQDSRVASRTSLEGRQPTTPMSFDANEHFNVPEHPNNSLGDDKERRKWDIVAAAAAAELDPAVTDSGSPLIRPVDRPIGRSIPPPPKEQIVNDDSNLGFTNRMGSPLEVPPPDEDLEKKYEAVKRTSTMSAQRTREFLLARTGSSNTQHPATSNRMSPTEASPTQGGRGSYTPKNHHEGVAVAIDSAEPSVSQPTDWLPVFISLQQQMVSGFCGRAAYERRRWSIIGHYFDAPFPAPPKSVWRLDGRRCTEVTVGMEEERLRYEEMIFKLTWRDTKGELVFNDAARGAIEQWPSLSDVPNLPTSMQAAIIFIEATIFIHSLHIDPKEWTPHQNKAHCRLRSSAPLMHCNVDGAACTLGRQYCESVQEIWKLRSATNGAPLSSRQRPPRSPRPQQEQRGYDKSGSHTTPAALMSHRPTPTLITANQHIDVPSHPNLCHNTSSPRTTPADPSRVLTPQNRSSFNALQSLLAQPFGSTQHPDWSQAPAPNPRGDHHNPLSIVRRQTPSRQQQQHKTSSSEEQIEEPKSSSFKPRSEVIARPGESATPSRPRDAMTRGPSQDNKSTSVLLRAATDECTTHTIQSTAPTRGGDEAGRPQITTVLPQSRVLSRRSGPSKTAEFEQSRSEPERETYHPASIEKSSVEESEELDALINHFVCPWDTTLVTHQAAIYGIAQRSRTDLGPYCDELLRRWERGEPLVKEVQSTWDGSVFTKIFGPMGHELVLDETLKAYARVVHLETECSLRLNSLLTDLKTMSSTATTERAAHHCRQLIYNYSEILSRAVQRRDALENLLSLRECDDDEGNNAQDQAIMSEIIDNVGSRVRSTVRGLIRPTPQTSDPKTFTFPNRDGSRTDSAMLTFRHDPNRPTVANVRRIAHGIINTRTATVESIATVASDYAVVEGFSAEELMLWYHANAVGDLLHAIHTPYTEQPTAVQQPATVQQPSSVDPPVVPEGPAAYPPSAKGPLPTRDGTMCTDPPHRRSSSPMSSSSSSSGDDGKVAKAVAQKKRRKRQNRRHKYRSRSRSPQVAGAPVPQQQQRRSSKPMATDENQGVCGYRGVEAFYREAEYNEKPSSSTSSWMVKPIPAVARTKMSVPSVDVDEYKPRRVDRIKVRRTHIPIPLYPTCCYEWMKQSKKKPNEIMLTLGCDGEAMILYDHLDRVYALPFYQGCPPYRPKAQQYHQLPKGDPFSWWPVVLGPPRKVTPLPYDMDDRLIRRRRDEAEEGQYVLVLPKSRRSAPRPPPTDAQEFPTPHSKKKDRGDTSIKNVPSSVGSGGRRSGKRGRTRTSLPNRLTLNDRAPKVPKIETSTESRIREQVLSATPKAGAGRSWPDSHFQTPLPMPTVNVAPPRGAPRMSQVDEEQSSSAPVEDHDPSQFCSPLSMKGDYESDGPFEEEEEAVAEVKPEAKTRQGRIVSEDFRTPAVMLGNRSVVRNVPIHRPPPPPRKSVKGGGIVMTAAKATMDLHVASALEIGDSVSTANETEVQLSDVDHPIASSKDYDEPIADAVWELLLQTAQEYIDNPAYFKTTAPSHNHHHHVRSRSGQLRTKTRLLPSEQMMASLENKYRKDGGGGFPLVRGTIVAARRKFFEDVRFRTRILRYQRGGGGEGEGDTTAAVTTAKSHLKPQSPPSRVEHDDIESPVFQSPLEEREKDREYVYQEIRRLMIDVENLCTSYDDQEAEPLVDTRAPSPEDLLTSSVTGGNSDGGVSFESSDSESDGPSSAGATTTESTDTIVVEDLLGVTHRGGTQWTELSVRSSSPMVKVEEEEESDGRRGCSDNRLSLFAALVTVRSLSESDYGHGGDRSSTVVKSESSAPSTPIPQFRVRDDEAPMPIDPELPKPDDVLLDGKALPLASARVSVKGELEAIEECVDPLATGRVMRSARDMVIEGSSCVQGRRPLMSARESVTDGSVLLSTARSNTPGRPRQYYLTPNIVPSTLTAGATDRQWFHIPTPTPTEQ